MDCRDCQPALLDLATGELGEETAAAARAHVQGCANCGAEFAKLSAGLRFARALETVPPPTAVGERLLALAEASAAARAHPRVEVATGSIWRSWLDFLSRFAMARQVGMAMITLLIVVVGLWSLPQLRRGPAARGGTVVNPDTDGEAAAAPGVRPAERLDLKVDVRAGRIRSKEDEPKPVVAPAASELAKSENAAAVEGARLRKPALDDRARALDDLDSVLEPESQLAAAPSPPAKAAQAREVKDEAQAPIPRARRGDPEGMPLGSVGKLAEADKLRRPEPNAFPASAQPVAAAAPVARVPATSGPARDIGESKATAKRSSIDDMLTGLDAEKSGAMPPTTGALHARGSAAPASASGSGRATVSATPSAGQAALLEDARASARREGCAAALVRYQQVVASAPASTAAGEALIEMAQCKRQLGDEPATQALLERATRIPAVSGRARALSGRAASKPTAADPLNPYR